MHADGVRLGVRLAPLVREDVVEVVDLTKAVAAEGQRIGHASEPPFTRVERALPPVHRTGVPVGHHHLADGRAVDERTHLAAVLVADGREDETLERVHAHPQRPLLPPHEIAVHHEARAFGLGDAERLEIGAQRPVVLGVVAARRRGHGDGAVVEHLEHLAPPHVDDGQQPLERTGIAIVVGRLAQVGQALGDPTPLLVLEPEGPCGPRVDLDERPVHHAAAVERGVPFLAPGQREQRGVGLSHLQRRADVLDHLPAHHLSPGDRDDRLDHVGLGALQQHHAHLAVDAGGGPRLPPVDRPHDLLGWIAQGHVGESEGVVRHGGPATVEDDLAGRHHLVTRQRRQRVERHRGGNGSGRH